MQPQRRPDDPYQQLLALPEHLTGEIIGGELVVSPRPAVPHTNVFSELGAELRVRFSRRPGGGDAPGGWWILGEPELHLGSDVLVPDIAGWKRENLTVLPRANSISVPPDWVCEILSPSTSRLDRGLRARACHRHGVRWRWLVDPLDQTVEAYRREGAFWVLLGQWSGEERARIEPFDAVELDLALWWEGIEPAPEPG